MSDLQRCYWLLTAESDYLVERAMCAMKVLLTLLICALSITGTRSLRFYLRDREKRCFSFEAPPNAVMLGEARAASGKGAPDILVHVIADRDSKTIFRRQLNHATKFSFRTPVAMQRHDLEGDDYDDYDGEDESQFDHSGMYSACITISHARNVHHDGSKRAVFFSIRDGHKDPKDGAATESDADQVQTAMRQMHDTLNQVIRDLALLQKRERTLLNKNQLVGARVLQLAILATLVLVATAASQVVYFKSFFKRKKLL